MSVKTYKCWIEGECYVEDIHTETNHLDSAKEYAEMMYDCGHLAIDPEGDNKTVMVRDCANDKVYKVSVDICFDPCFIAEDIGSGL